MSDHNACGGLAPPNSMKKSMLTEADGEEEGALELHSELKPALRLRLYIPHSAG